MDLILSKLYAGGRNANFQVVQYFFMVYFDFLCTMCM